METVEFEISVSENRSSSDLISVESGEMGIACVLVGSEIPAVEQEFRIEFEQEITPDVDGIAIWSIEVELIAVPASN